MRTKVLYMLALLLVLSVGQADAQRILPRMQGVEMRGVWLPITDTIWE